MDLALNASSPNLVRLESGHGFATVDKSGRIIVRSTFTIVDDLVAYLKQNFPERLTPEQRRAFFIE